MLFRSSSSRPGSRPRAATRCWLRPSAATSAGESGGLSEVDRLVALARSGSVKALAFDPAFLGPEAFRAFLAAERLRWRDIIARTGLRLEG
mgnify:CR=1 FL=1